MNAGKKNFKIGAKRAAGSEEAMKKEWKRKSKRLHWPMEAITFCIINVDESSGEMIPTAGTFPALRHHYWL